jgi:hypothetical protein
MAGIKETKENLRKEIRELFLRLTSEHEFIFSSEPETAKLNAYSDIASQLAKKTATYAHLISVEEEKPIVEISQPVSIPTPEPAIPPKEIVPPVIFENPVAEIPVVPVEQKTEPRVETPVAPPTKKYPDIKSLIGFNERLMFMKNLFHSDGSAYESAIDQLNNCNSYEEAKAFLSVVGSEYKWNTETEPVFIFNSIVKRRFA